MPVRRQVFVASQPKKVPRTVAGLSVAVLAVSLQPQQSYDIVAKRALCTSVDIKIFWQTAHYVVY